MLRGRNGQYPCYRNRPVLGPGHELALVGPGLTLTLISNSDAHSPAKIGREANIFETELSYPAIIEAIKKKDPARFSATIEFFPEEGKYHFDGHRSCRVCFSPGAKPGRRMIAARFAARKSSSE